MHIARLCCVELLIHQHPQVFRAGLIPSSAQPGLLLGIAQIHMQDLTLGPVELHEVYAGPPLKSAKVSGWRI